jgi:hypothetical protein
LLLTYLGHQPVEPPFVLLGQLATVAFFLVLILLCVARWAESILATVPLHNSTHLSKKATVSFSLFFFLFSKFMFFH